MLHSTSAEDKQWKGKLREEYTMEQIRLPWKLSTVYSILSETLYIFLIPSWKGINLSSLLNPLCFLLGMRIFSPHETTFFWSDVQNLGLFLPLCFQKLHIISPPFCCYLEWRNVFQLITSNAIDLKCLSSRNRCPGIFQALPLGKAVWLVTSDVFQGKRYAV